MTDLPQRPESFNFSLDFLGSSDAAELLAYVEALEDRWQQVRPRITPRRPVDAMTTQPMSPAAQAVLDAATTRWLHVDDDIPAQVAVAALRAAADQVVPPALEMEFFDRNQALPLQKMVEIRLSIRVIAAELEGAQ